MDSTPPRRKVSVSLSGCGFLGIYHIGVVSCLREFEEHFEIERYAGASAGAIAAACHLCNVCWGQATKDVLKTAAAARASPVGPLSPRFNLVRILRNGLIKLLPENAHEICNGRLSVSLTRVHDGKNVMIEHFTSKDDLIQALICTSFVPVYSGLIPPFFRNARFWDGGLSNNLPIFDGDTITVSPFSGESDICPPDSSSAFMEMNFSSHSIRLNSRNIYRISRALFPPHPECLSDICEEGYLDAMRYIKKYLICKVEIPRADQLTSVDNFLSQSSCEFMEDQPKSTPDSAVENRHNKEESRAEKALQILEKYARSGSSNLPTSVVEALKEACESTQHPALRALAYVTIPWVLPLEFMYTTCTRIVELVPKPGTAEILYYSEFFSCVAQRCAVKLLSRHGTKSWNMNCECTLESVTMNQTNSSCHLHGNQRPSHSLKFAFAMSIEETHSSSAIETPNNGLHQKSISFPESVAEVHSGSLEVMVDDSATFSELQAIMDNHDEAIVDYFQALLAAPQAPLTLSIEQLPSES